MSCRDADKQNIVARHLAGGNVIGYIGIMEKKMETLDSFKGIM